MTKTTSNDQNEQSIAVLADENMAALEACFPSSVTLRRQAGRDVCSASLAESKALLVRSITRVDEPLLKGSQVSFVGSATIGTDHIDLDYLRDNHIEFVNAPGSNADSVADYVCSALAALVSDLTTVKKRGLSAGVIGFGQVGSRVAKRLQALGYIVRAYDPLIDQTKSDLLGSLSDVINSDVVSVHVPLTKNGEHATYHMVNGQFLSQLPNNTVLINSSRGEVAENKALKHWLSHSLGAQAVLDVWEFEPDVDPNLLSMASIGTAHIAGYALDGKIRGTAMLADAFYQHFSIQQSAVQLASNGEQTGHDSDLVEPGGDRLEIAIEGNETLNDLLLMAYDIRTDDLALRHSVLGEPSSNSNETPRLSFDELRKHYPVRREFSCTTFKSRQALSDSTDKILLALGFTVSY